MKKLSLTLAALVLAASPALAWHSAPNSCGYHQHNSDGSDFAAVQSDTPIIVGPTATDTGANPPWTPVVNTTISTSYSSPDLWVNLAMGTHLAVINESFAPGSASPVLISSNVCIQTQLLVDGNPVPFAGTTTTMNLDCDIMETSDSPSFLTQAGQEAGTRPALWSIPNPGRGSHKIEVDVRFVFHPIGDFANVRAAAIVSQTSLTAQSVNLD